MAVQLHNKCVLGEFELEPDKYLLKHHNQYIHLPELPFQVLLYLVENRERYVSRQELLERFWSGSESYEETLTKCISTIRTELNDPPTSPTYIETRKKVGYRYVGPFEEERRPDLHSFFEVERTRGLEISVEEHDDEVENGRATEKGISTQYSLDPLYLREPQHSSRTLPVVLTISLIALTASALIFYRHRFSSQSNQPALVRSIAVLPLRNLSDDVANEYFSDGMTESLISSLSKIDGLKVISRGSVFKFKAEDVDPREAGRQLGVAAVLEGSVRRDGDTVRVEVRLVNAADGQVLWAGGPYDRALREIFALQDEIARNVAIGLRFQFSEGDGRRLAGAHTVNVEAYQLYLKGRYFWNKRSEESLKKAVEFFNQALEKDRNYALAYAGLADCYTLLTTYNYGQLPPEEGFPKAKKMALQALQIDESLAEAHASLATIHHWYEHDYASAEREFKRALELSPNYAAARHWYATYLREAQRDDEAFAEIKRAQELDPLSLVINGNVAQHYYFRRDYDRAIEQMLKTIEIDPNFSVSYQSLAYYYEKKGMYEEAIKAARKAFETSGDGQYAALVARNYALSGRREQARKILRELMELRTRRFVSPTLVALVYDGLGEMDQAFVWLNKAQEERDVMIRSLKQDPVFDGLRSDPRFADLERRVGLPQ
jgi:TolB-like protein/DNA-binding winged helix-turn-helix (wHTH) protein/Tfp pilus assembly protein PilF